MIVRGLRFTALRLAGAAAVLAAAVLPAGAGDLGRDDPSFFDGLLPRQLWYGPQLPRSIDPLTDDEIELRDRAYTLIRPNEPRGEWNLIVEYFRISQALPPILAGWDRRQYGRMVLWTPGRSEASQYFRVIEDVRADHQLIGPFITIACRVADMDRKRRRSLAYVADLSAFERDNALGRVTENRIVTAWVAEMLDNRHASYRYALERLVIAVPSPRAVDAERAIEQFRSAVAQARGYLARCGADPGGVPVAPARAHPVGIVSK